jgi:hypothetical protein
MQYYECKKILAIMRIVLEHKIIFRQLEFSALFSSLNYLNHL